MSSDKRRRLRPATTARVMRAFRPALSGQRRALVAALALTLLGTALELARPWPIRYLFDDVLLAGTYDATPLVLAALAPFVIGLLLGNTEVLRATVVARIGLKVATRVRRDVFAHMQRLGLTYHMSQRRGDLLMRLMGDVDMVRDLLFASWLSLIGRAALLIGASAYMFRTDPLLAGVALFPVPFLAVGLQRGSKRLRGVTRKQRRKHGRAAALAAQSLQHIHLLKAYAAEDRVTAAFTHRVGSGERAGGKAARIAAEIGSLAEILTGAGLALVLMFGSVRVLDGVLTPGDLLVMVSYTRALYKPLRKLSRESARLAKATACAERITEILDHAPEDHDTGEPAPRFRGEIELRDVRFAYSAGVNAARGLNLHVPAGSLVLVTGSNGAGKSTLLRLLLRLFVPQRGAITVDGQPIESYRLSGYRERIAYVPQQTLLLDATVAENIALGKPDASQEEIEAAARVALVHEFVARLPDGYDTRLGEDGAALSGGEARRLMLARAAVRDASIVLLDEPLAGLDPRARRNVARAVRRIAAGRTTLVVHHGPDPGIDPDTELHLSGGGVASHEPLQRAHAS